MLNAPPPPPPPLRSGFANTGGYHILVAADARQPKGRWHVIMRIGSKLSSTFLMFSKQIPVQHN